MQPVVIHHRAFTLVELLVVLGVIAILVAITTPCYIVVRAKASEANCLSNLRQIGQSIALYSSDYDQCYPLAATHDNVWTGRVSPYLHNTDVFRCPSWQRPLETLGAVTLADGTHVPHDVSYVYNVHIGGFANYFTLSGDKIVNRSDVFAPANTVLLSEGNATPVVGIAPDHWALKQYFCMTSIFLADASYSGVIDPQTSGFGAPFPLHGGNASVLYADLHAKVLKVEKFYSLPDQTVDPKLPKGYSPCLDPSRGCP